MSDPWLAHLLYLKVRTIQHSVTYFQALAHNQDEGCTSKIFSHRPSHYLVLALLPSKHAWPCKKWKGYMFYFLLFHLQLWRDVSLATLPIHCSTQFSLSLSLYGSRTWFSLHHHALRPFLLCLYNPLGWEEGGRCAHEHTYMYTQKVRTISAKCWHLT